jgi:hypothetical protein
MPKWGHDWFRSDIWQIRQCLLIPSGWIIINRQITCFHLLSIVCKSQNSENQSGDLRILSKAHGHPRQFLAMSAWYDEENFAWRYQNYAWSKLDAYFHCFIHQVQGTIARNISGLIWLLGKQRVARIFPLLELKQVLKVFPWLIAAKKSSQTDHEAHDREEWRLGWLNETRNS